MPRGSIQPYRPPSLCETLSTGITKVDPNLPIVKSCLVVPNSNNSRYTVDLRINQLKKNIAADAALGFGQKLLTFASGTLVLPVFTRIEFTLVVPTGLSTTAGDVGLGSVIATGAVAVLDGTATFENYATGQTLTGNSANTSQTDKFNVRDAVHTAAIVDNTSAAVSEHLNIASTFNQTAAEDAKFSARIIMVFDQVQV